MSGFAKKNTGRWEMKSGSFPSALCIGRSAARHIVFCRYQSRMIKTNCPTVKAPMIVKQGTTVIYPVKISAKTAIEMVKVITLKPLAIAALLSAMFLSSFSSISISLDLPANRSHAPDMMTKIPIREVPVTIRARYRDDLMDPQTICQQSSEQDDKACSGHNNRNSFFHQLILLVYKYFLNAHIKVTGDLKCQLNRRVVPPVFQGTDRLP